MEADQHRRIVQHAEAGRHHLLETADDTVAADPTPGIVLLLDADAPVEIVLRGGGQEAGVIRDREVAPLLEEIVVEE